MRKKTTLCFALTIICLFSAVQATLAAWRVSDPSIHAISIASLSGRIVEQYEEATDVKPGQEVDKIVNVQNTGSADSVIRIKLEKAWGQSRNEAGNLIPDTSYPTDNIIIECNTEHWYYNESDGYYYYKGVLKSGETTMQPLMESFSVDRALVRDDDNNILDYNGMTADIVVKLECLQAAANAIEEIWNVSLGALGITYESSQQTDDISYVSFIGQGGGFSFDPTSTDLFVNFKDLLPGETRAQTINVRNASTEATEMFLRAEVTERGLSEADPRTLELINKLLKEYVLITVTTDSGTVIYEGPVWGNPESDATNPASMRNDISLGNFNGGQEKKLQVQLRVDPKVDNEYQALWAYIRWVWSAQGEDEPYEPPKTGDENDMYIYFGIMFFAALLLIPLTRSRREEKAAREQFNIQNQKERLS